MLREFRVGAGLLFPAPPRRSQASLAQVPGFLGAGVFFGRGTCTANRPPTPSSGAGPHPFSTPAPNTPDTCAKNRHHLRQLSCFPVAKWVFAKMPHGRTGSTRQVGGCGAPIADIGQWRTATIDTKRRKVLPVRLFGDGQRRGSQRDRAFRSACAPLSGTSRCSVRQGSPAGLPVGPGVVPTGRKNREKLPHRSLKWTYGNSCRGGRPGRGPTGTLR